MWWCAALLALAAGPCRAWECPARCACAGAALTELTCGEHIYRVRDDGYVEVDCQGASLSCADVPPLPRVRSLQRLEVSECAVGVGAGACVAGAAGGAVGGPPTLLTRGLRAPLSLDALQGLQNVTKLFMHNAHAQRSLPPLREALPSLREFRLVGGNGTALSPPLPPALQYLELTACGVNALPRAAFQGLSQLEKLIIFQNKLEAIEYEDLQPLTSLRYLSVSFTPVRRLRVSRLTSLRDVTVSNVNMSELHEGDVSGLPALESLTVKSLVPLRLRPRSLTSLPALTSLRVTQSRVTSLPPDLLLNTSSLVNVSFAWNDIAEIPDTLFQNLSALERLDLSHNSLQAVSQDTFSSLGRLRELMLHHNRIQVLPTRAFTSCTSLEKLSLSSNLLSTLPSPLFPLSLRSLSLAGNRLQWAPPPSAEEYWWFPPSPFNELLQLEELDLSSNQISVMFPDLRLVLVQRLHYLDLSHNAFTELTEADTQFLAANLTVDLRHNNISRLQPHSSSSPSPSQQFLLAGNPWQCDCLLYPLLQQRDRSPYQLSDASCASPPPLAGSQLRTLPLALLTCPLLEQPENCSCLYRPALQRCECTCSLADLTLLPDFTHVDGVEYLALTLTQINQWDGLDSLPDFVRELNVSGIGLTDFDYNVSNVRVLDLTNNHLKRVPLQLLQANRTVYLRGNPIACDCFNSEFLQQLNKHSSRVGDYELVQCGGGGRLGTVDVGSLCDVYILTVAGSALVLLCILIAATVPLCWRHKLRIRQYLSTFPGLEFLDDEDVEGKQYDVFVSFSHEDFPYIKEVLLPVLDAQYSVCVHYREWEVGAAIPLQIRRSVATSRRTLVVLSPRYAASRWAVAEFREAAAGRGLVLVLLEDVAAAALPPDVREYLSSTTYLHADDPRFWDKLRRALPRRPLRTQPPGDSTPPALAPHKPPALDVVLNERGDLVNRGYVKDV